MRRALLLATVLLLTTSLQAAPHRRALLIGINDYSASRLPVVPGSASPAPGRDWPNLAGAVTDVRLVQGMLLSLYAFDPGDIVTLTDQEATRGAILNEIGKLVAGAGRNDIVLIYFSGHGSQVANSLSDEADHLDESLVPADSRRGAEDIRDKTLRTAFNRIVDHGARLTVVLDSCHSASGTRGFDSGLRTRGVSRDGRDVADRANGPRPEDRGALIFSAAEDFDAAYETMDEHHTIHGAFSWALARAMRDAEPGEPASDTFLRAQARLHAEQPAQTPVIAGSPTARMLPFLGDRPVGARLRKGVVAIDHHLPSGAYQLRGGWVDGLTKGSELRVVGQEHVRLEVTSLLDVSASEARLTGPPPPALLQAGTLLEISAWAAPPGKPLRVWIPTVERDLTPLARELRANAAQRGIRWLDDPTETTPTHSLRWHDGAWQLVAGGRAVGGGATPLENVPRGAALFVQLPVNVDLGKLDGIELVPGPQNADYILMGRLAGSCMQYAFVRPLVTAADASRSALPVRTAWTSSSETLPLILRDALLRLQRIHGWQELTSPAAASTLYHLAIRRATDGSLMRGAKLEGDAHYRLVLQARGATSKGVSPRYVYVFMIDSHGNGVLLFPDPDAGSAENLFPIPARPGEALRNAPAEIELGNGQTFSVLAPYGVDTYFLLSTEEPLSNLDALQWTGVRGESRAAATNPLERLLATTGTRGVDDIRTPLNWTIEKVVFDSSSPGKSTP